MEGKNRLRRALMVDYRILSVVYALMVPVGGIYQRLFYYKQ